AGKPIPSIVGYTNGLIPKGAKNVTVAKEFLKYFIQPKVIGEFVELGLGRWLPVMPSLAKSPFWQNPKDPHLKGYVQQGLLGPTRPEETLLNVSLEVRIFRVLPERTLRERRHDRQPAAQTKFDELADHLGLDEIF